MTKKLLRAVKSSTGKSVYVDMGNHETVQLRFAFKAIGIEDLADHMGKTESGRAWYMGLVKEYEEGKLPQFGYDRAVQINRCEWEKLHAEVPEFKDIELEGVTTDETVY